MTLKELADISGMTAEEHTSQIASCCSGLDVNLVCKPNISGNHCEILFEDAADALKFLNAISDDDARVPWLQGYELTIAVSASVPIDDLPELGQVLNAAK